MIDLDLSRIVPDPSRSIRDGAIIPWTTPKYREWNEILVKSAKTLGVRVDVPFAGLNPDEVAIVVDGSGSFPGLRGFFRLLERKTYKLHVRVFLSRWRGYSPCPECEGKRLRPEALAVKVAGLDIAEVLALTIARVLDFLTPLNAAAATGRRVLEGAIAKVSYLDRIGLGYLTLDRPARTLSGGETRRVSLSTALGSGLVNTLYVLDEPSIGLHPRDVGRLIAAMQRLRDQGNALIVVEHDEAVMRAADLLVEIGPGAGESGGHVVYAGSVDGISAVKGSPTGEFLATRAAKNVLPRKRRPADKASLEILGALGNNLKDIDVNIPAWD